MSGPAEPAPAPVDAPPEVPWRWPDAVLVVVLVFLSGIVVMPLVSTLGEYANSALLVVSGVVTAALTVFVARSRYGAQAATLLWGHRRPRGADVLIGIGAALAAQIGVSVIVLLLSMGGDPPTVQEELRRAASNPATLPLMVLGAVVLVPVAEELLYRGMLFQGLRSRYGRWPAIGVSGFFFGLLHVQWGNLGGTLLLLSAFYPLGMWLAWLFDRRGTLVVPIVCHVVYNGGNLAVFLSGR